MFNRWLLRVDQQYAFVMANLRTNTFKLDTEQKVPFNRRDADRPKDLTEAQTLWLQRLDLEFLTEKLNKPTVAEASSNLWTKISRHGRTNPLNTDNPDSKKIGPVFLEGTNLLARLTNVDSIIGTNRAPEFTKLVEEKRFASSKDIENYLATWFPAYQQEEIVQTLARRYNRTLRNLKQIEAPEALQFYLDSLARSFDPHSSYFDKRAAESFHISMNLALFGIGATLSSEDGYTVIRDVKAGSPAEKSKQVKIGDKIVAVAQEGQPPVDVVEEKLSRVVDQIRGPKDTKVTLTIIPSGADSSKRRLVTIVRDEIKLEEAAAKARLVEIPGPNGKTNRLGVIDLPSFYGSFNVGGRSATSLRSPTLDVAKLLRKLMEEKVDGVILDLRANGGGLLEECVTLTGLFIKSGPVVQLVDTLGRVRVLGDEDPRVVYDGPLMVLTSRNSASASEILAAALQDYGRALIVGEESTHGKGTAQHPLQLRQYFVGDSDPGEVKITDNKFYRVTGASTQLKGVVPDVVLPSINVVINRGEASLSNALPWDTIVAASFDHLDKLQPLIPELRHRSEERVAKDPDFDYVREDIARFKKQEAEKVVSLSEPTRRAEQLADKERAEKRKREILARGEKEPLTYEISLKDADKPGLPAPMTNKTVVAISRRDVNTLKVDKAAAPPSLEDDDDELGAAAAEDSAAVDIQLREAEKILLDWVQLGGARSGTTAQAGTK
jgi:carboxyl-terminal processing protease